MHTTKDGTAAFYGTVPLLSDTKPDAYQKAMELSYEGHAVKVMKQYPPSRFGGNIQSAVMQANADSTVICPSLKIARTLSRLQENSVKIHHAIFSHFQTSL